MILKFKCAPSNYREVQLKPHWGGNNLHPAIHLCLGRGTAPEVERSLPQHCKPTCTGSSALFCVIQGAGVLMNPSERHYQNAGGSWRILRQMFAAPILPDPCPHTHPTQSSPPPPAASLTVQVRSFSPSDPVPSPPTLYLWVIPFLCCPFRLLLHFPLFFSAASYAWRVPSWFPAATQSLQFPAIPELWHMRRPEGIKGWWGMTRSRHTFPLFTTQDGN